MTKTQELYLDISPSTRTQERSSPECPPTLVNVHTTGTNEFSPRFQQQVFQFVVSESAMPGTAVGQNQTSHLDQGRNAAQQDFRIDKWTETESSRTGSSSRSWPRTAAATWATTRMRPR